MIRQLSSRVEVRLGSKGEYWQASWTPDLQHPSARKYKSIGSKKKYSKTQAKVLCRRLEDEINQNPRRLVNGRLPTFDQLRSEYQRARAATDGQHARASARWIKDYPKLSPKTLRCHDLSLRYLADHFGQDRMIDCIDRRSAESFIEKMAAGLLSSAHSDKRTRPARTEPMAEESIRTHIRQLKTIYNWAIAVLELPIANPFGAFSGKSGQGRKCQYIEASTMAEILTATDDHRWRALFGLTRYAGLRLSMALRMPWSGKEIDRNGEEHSIGVDWDRRRLCAVGKTGKYREIPIVAELERVLTAAHAAAPEGSTIIIGDLSTNNLTRRQHTIIKRAGHQPWQNPWQTLRQSREQQWKLEGIPEPTYTYWLGHSMQVSRQSYLHTPTEAEFESQVQEKTV